ncbi:DUF6603 domain-containing protein [Neptunomonas sp.]|uniref:DUF6603 domain-containing protein n=1 Tax=Neptunomonas sp. TaxID=1971898 RepID=UPI003561E5CC
MSDNWISLSTVSAECANDVRLALGVSRLPEKGGDGEMLGVPCHIETYGIHENSDLVVVCAYPEQPWNFGYCFPQLPGAWQQGNTFRHFNLRFLGLDKALWVYVWMKGEQFEKIWPALIENAVFIHWNREQDSAIVKSILGLIPEDLQRVPRPSQQVRINGKPFGGRKENKEIVKDGLFMWGFVKEPLGMLRRSIHGVIEDDEQSLPYQRERDEQLPVMDRLSHMREFLGDMPNSIFAKAKTTYAKPEIGNQETSRLARYLQLQMPPHSTEFGVSELHFYNAALTFTAPLYYSPHNTRIGLKADFDLLGNMIEINLEYPIDGDVITAKGKYLGNPTDLLGESETLGMPSSHSEFRSDTEVDIEFEFSKSEKTLTKIEFDIELHKKHWEVVPAPISLALEGLSFRVQIYNPLHKKSRLIFADITAEAALGDASKGDTPVRLMCGGSYPSADLFLQARNQIPLGKLLEKLLGESEGLDKLTLDNLRVEYNYRSGQMGLMFDVPEQWTIVHKFALSEISLHIQGRKEFSGGIAATLEMGSVAFYLTGLYDQGWQIEGSTAPGKVIHIDVLLEALTHQLGVDDAGCASLEGKTLKNLHVYFNTASKDFIFAGEVDLWMEKILLKTVVSITVKHLSDGSVSKTFSGVIQFETGDDNNKVLHEFDVVFDKRDITLASGSESLSTMIAAYRADPNHPLSLEDLAPGKHLPNIESHGVFIAHQKSTAKDADPKKKWLLGISLDAGIDLSNVKLPNIPLMGAGGPPKSLKLDLQILLATGPGAFEEEELGVIGDLNMTGDISIPAQKLEGSAVACSILMDGMTVTLNLPVKTGNSKDAAFVHDPDMDAGQKPHLPIAPHAVAVTPSPEGTKWIKIQKNFGPIHIERIGVKFEPKGGLLFIYLDGGLTVGALTLSLHGLGVDTPLTEFDPHFHISGIGIDYKGGSIELGGAFLKGQIPDPDPNVHETITAYSGEAVLRTEALSLSAIGSYFEYKGESSLFIYALLEYPLGGPPFFFVTGLAAGFGYNRQAIVPGVEQIHHYPLVTKAIAGAHPNAASKDGARAQTPNLAAELASLEAYVPPMLGEAFLAIGVKFSSFELIDSFALVIAQFGEQNQFDLVGVSHLQIPSKEAGGQPGSLLAEVYMNWKAYFRPVEGVVGLKAELAPGSYILSQDCHLTGDFAYFAWFGGDHAGDFVYTLGGYHPDFIRPAHYPTANRLAFNWHLGAANLDLKGAVYYALTAHAFMAGGALDATMHGGFDIGIAGIDFRADLHISADFIITWQPFHYDGKVKLDLKIDISAHLLFCSKHFSLDVGADMHLWGPEFAGEAKIYLKVWVISHTLDVKFGQGAPKLRPINWQKFYLAFLPKTLKDPAKPKAIQKVDASAVCGVAVQGGLIRSSGDRWIMSAKDFCLVTDSMIPITDAQCGTNPPLVHGNQFVELNGIDHHLASNIETDFGIASMGVKPDGLTTRHHIKILRNGSDGSEYFRCEPVLKRLPAAVWEAPSFVDGSGEEYLNKPDINPKRSLISNLLAGLKIYPAVLLKEHKTLLIERSELQYEVTPVYGKDPLLEYQWQQIPEYIAPSNDTAQIEDSFAAKRATDLRDDILTELGLMDVVGVFNHPLESTLQASSKQARG